MPYPTTLPTKRFLIRYSGIFDFAGLYQLMADWMKARRYWFQETDYKHKVNPGGAEQEIDFDGERQITEYIKENVHVFIHIWDMTEVEVERNGIKKKLANGRIELIIFGKLELDWEGRWKGSKILEFFGDFYNRYIMRKTVEDYWDKLHYRMIKFQDMIKQFLDMQSKGNEYAGYLGDNV